LLVVGLAGAAVGLVAVLFRLKRPRGLALSVDLFFAAEGLLTVFFVEILVLSGYWFVVDRLDGAPWVLDRFGDSVARALDQIFALAGGQ
jgi:hypothetical protein